MIYKSFRVNCVLRIVLLIATVLAFVYLLFNTELYVTTAIAGIMIILQSYGLIGYVEKTNQLLTRFLDSIRYSDFTQSFTRTTGGKSFAGLTAAFNEVMEKFQQARAEKEEHYRYLQTVVQHVGIGLISFKPDGTVGLVNTAARKLLQIPNLKNINDLRSVSKPLVERLHRLKAGENALVKININNELMQLAVYATEFRLRQESYMLVSLQNITGELAEKEMEAWQSLVRVLTHEIMNSVTPISSLAATVNNLLLDNGSTKNGRLKTELEAEAIEDIGGALRTIQKRSVSLLNFMESYRNLTRIPKPNFQLFPVSELFERVVQLMKPQLEENKIEFKSSLNPHSLELTADPGMVEQVLINLMLNAIHAVSETASPKIELTAEMSGKGNLLIHVADNGPGIPEESLEKIFIPFYTTKKEGSGIGLSLSRQIMRLHHAGIIVTSKPNERTVFTMKF